MDLFNGYRDDYLELYRETRGKLSKAQQNVSDGRTPLSMIYMIYMI